MTPEKRLDQIEPELVEVIQKVDRLIESNGKIVELAIDTKAELSETKETVNRIDNEVAALKVTGDSTARALANLTVATQQQFEKVDGRFDQSDKRFDRLEANQNDMRQDIAELKMGQALILQILRDKLP